MQDDDTRAALWRQQRINRLTYQAQLWRGMAGDPAARAALHAAWAPLELWMLERQQPDLDPQTESDPLGISETVNVGL